MIDEDALNPPEYNLISGIYLTNSKNIVTFKKDLSYVGASTARDYSCLDFAITNLSKDIRRYFMQNINSNESTLQNFIKAYSKLNEIEHSDYQEILKKNIEYFIKETKSTWAKSILNDFNNKAQNFILVRSNFKYMGLDRVWQSNSFLVLNSAKLLYIFSLHKLIL